MVSIIGFVSIFLIFSISFNLLIFDISIFSNDTAWIPTEPICKSVNIKLSGLISNFLAIIFFQEFKNTLLVS